MSPSPSRLDAVSMATVSFMVQNGPGFTLFVAVETILTETLTACRSVSIVLQTNSFHGTGSLH